MPSSPASSSPDDGCRSPGWSRRALRLRFRFFRGTRLDAAAVGDAKLAFHHHLLAVGETLADHRLITDGAVDLDWPELGGVVRLHHIDVAAVLSNQDCRLRDDDRVLLGAQRGLDVDELAGPEPLVGVLEDGADTNGAGGHIDLIVEQIDAAAVDTLQVARDVDLHRHLAGG